MGNATEIIGTEDNAEKGFLLSLLDAIFEEKKDFDSRHPPNAVSLIFATGNYSVSSYALACLIMAMILNRTLVFASTNPQARNELRKNQLKTRLRSSIIIGLRLSAIYFLVQCGYNVLVALNLSLHLSDTLLSWLFYLIPDFLFSYDATNVPSKYMRTAKYQVMVGPGSGMFWPVFLSICYLTFVETLVSVLDGSKPYTETGFTIFEHSIALHETSFELHTSAKRPPSRPHRNMLVLCLYSIYNHLNVQIGGIVNGNKYRLVPSTIGGLAFLGFFVVHFPAFPVSIMLTVMPQVLILSVFMISSLIFLVAVIANGFSLRGLACASFLLNEDDDNERSYLNISLDEDFSKALLNCGVMAIISAGKSSYISELSLVNVNSNTWMEKSFWEKVHSGAPMPVLKAKGYGNFISHPQKYLMQTEKKSYLESNTSIGTCYKYLKEILVTFSELLWGLFVNKVVKRKTVPISDRESDEQFEQRKKALPTFLQKFTKKRKLDSGVGSTYSDLVADVEFPEEDYSHDFVPDEESDLESLAEEASEVISELLGDNGLHELIGLSTGVLHEHLGYDGILTRSKYKAMADTTPQDDTSKFLQLLVSKRSEPHEHEVDDRFLCVICRCNDREIITWPCKCFAICEPCRLSLVTNGIEGCVCCRKEVEGVSKVFIL